MQEHSCTVRGKHLQAARAVLRAGHAEPDRTRRHLSAAGSATRPLPVQHRARLPHRRGGDGGHRPDHDHHARAPRPRPSPTPRRSSASSNWCAWCRWPSRWPATRWIWCARPAARTRRPDFVKQYVNYRRQRSRRAVPDPGGQGAGADEAPLSRQRTRTSARCSRRCCGTAYLLNFQAESERLSLRRHPGAAARVEAGASATRRSGSAG